MATVQIKIKTIGDTDVKIDQIKKSGTAEVTNGSIQVDKNGYFTANSSKDDFLGQEMFTFTSGGLKFSSDEMLVNADENRAVLVDEKYGNEFVWGVVPTSKAYTVEMTIELSDLKLTALTFVGDRVARQFPTRIVIENEEYANDEADITLPISGTKKSVLVKFTEWNRANYSAVLTKVAIMADEITLGNSDIKTIESQSQSTSQPTDIYYGSVPSSGSANIYDKNGDFYDHIRNGVLPNSNVPVELFVNGKRVQGHISTDSNYDINGRTFSLDFENKLSLYEKVMYEGHDYSEETDNLYGLFKSFCKSVGISSDKMEIMLSNQIVYGTPSKLGSVADYFRAITVPYPYIERGTVRETFDKFCQLTQLNLIENDNGDLVFVQSRPVRAGNEQVLVIPTHCQMSTIDTDVIIENGIDTANVVYQKIINDEYISTNVATATAGSPQLDGANITYWGRMGGEEVFTIASSNYTKKLAVYTGLKTRYYTGSVKIPKYKKNEVIDNLYGGIANSGISYRLIYKKKTGKARYTVQGTLSYDSDNYAILPSSTAPSISSITYSYDDEVNEYEETTTDTSTLAFGTAGNLFSFYKLLNYQNAQLIFSGNQVAVNLTNLLNGSWSYNSTTKEYTFDYKVLGYKFYVRMIADMPKKSDNATAIEFLGENYNETERHITEKGVKTFYKTHLMQNPTSTDVSYLGGTGPYSDTPEGIEEYSARYLEINFFGDKRTISFEETNLIDEIADDENVINISGNEILQDVTEVKIGNTSTPIAEQISKNITSDYKNGIETMRLTVCCADYKDTYGVVRKNWSKGEIFEVGDIVRVDKDNNGTPAVTYKNGNAKLWKVTGRTFRNEGVPLVDLELQEII